MKFESKGFLFHYYRIYLSFCSFHDFQNISSDISYGKIPDSLNQTISKKTKTEFERI